MNIVIPMAGRGSRLRPHTLTIPKPLIPIAGKSIVQRLVEDIVRSCAEDVENICFIVGDFGSEVENELIKIAENMGAKGHIRYQNEPLGTAHAILCGEEFLNSHTVIAFADTLFMADFKIDKNQDGIIWVKKVDDPSAFGVVQLDEAKTITDFVEKPETFVSDLAIIGIYYFSDGEFLKSELQYVIDNDIREKGEYQLTTALENMKNKGKLFKTGEVVEWLDCGNKDATVFTNQRILENYAKENLIDEETIINNTCIIKPCYIGKGVKIENSVVGPHVSIHSGSSISSSVVRNSLIQSNSVIKNKVLQNSMIGSDVIVDGEVEDLSLGDFTSIIG
ncbi:MAG: nucleotidyltransferase [Chitinophagales bacterium]|nr:nucleotidyltransferase [Chitinophagales bacterium]